MKLSHVDEAGRARMVDVGGKPITVRTAVAEGGIRMSDAAFRLVAEQHVTKGDVLAVSEVAGTLTTIHPRGGRQPHAWVMMADCDTGCDP